MFDINSITTDEKLENEGVWHPIGKGSRLLVARAGNKAYAKLLAQMFEQNQAVIDLGGDIGDAKSEEVMIEVMARTILLGWEKFGKGGVETPYSTAAAREFLKIKDFRNLVRSLSNNMEAYLVKQEAAQGEA